MQSRVTTVLTIACMGAIGAGLLSWYYSKALTRHERATHSAQSASQQKARGEMALPPLGHFTPPKVVAPPKPAGTPSPAPATEPDKTLETLLGPRPLLPEPSTTAPLIAGSMANQAPAYGVSTYAQPTAKTPAQLAFERRLSGPVFTPVANGPVSGAPVAPRNEGEPQASYPLSGVATPMPVGGSASVGPAGPAGGVDGLNALLRPMVTPAVPAQVLPTQRFLLPKGAFIDCTLETAIDSTLPGLTTCITATDVFGADGTTVLLERGTKLVGETRGDVRQGAARVFVLWTEARTPTGVVIALASPGTDELGRSGVSGVVDRHFVERFGAAMLITVLEGAVQAATARSGNGAIILNPAASTDVAAEVLRSTVNIPPTVRKQNGDRIQVLVARDLDFRSVYELRPAAAQ
jgi:type IV secretion system protein VirB10